MSIKAKCQIVNGRRFNVSWRRCRCNQQATLKYSNLVGFISSITLEKGYDGVKTRDVPACLFDYNTAILIVSHVHVYVQYIYL
jgi:hypothetical protein